MSTILNATTSSGLAVSSDNSGAIQFQTNGVNTVGIDTSGNITPAGTVVMGSSFLRNRIINGNMVIDQRNAGAQITVGTSSTFSVDRFQINKDTVSGTLYAQQSTTASSGFSNSLLFTANTAWTPAASDLAAFQQKVEAFNTSDLGFGTASASTVTLSFWVRASITGTYCVALLNSADNRSYVATYTVNVANTFEYKTITITGDTAGIWVSGTNGIGIRVNFDLGSGSTYNTTAGSWASGFYTRTSGSVNWTQTNGATFYITGVQLEQGTVATPFERQIYSNQLAQCQRYYYRMSPNSSYAGMFGSGYIYASTFAICYQKFPVSMRAAPTALEQSGTASHYGIYGVLGTTTCTSVPLYNSGDFDGATTQFFASGQTTGQGTIGRSNNTSAYLGWSAEL
jgi:hypothetical protein